MNLTRRHVLLMMWIGAFLNLAPMPAEAAVRHIYLTWSGDPASSVRINVHTMTTPGQLAPQIHVVYDTVRAGAPGQYRWASTSTHIDPIEALPGRTVHSVLLDQLQPGTRHYYRVLSSQDAASTVYHFRTMPDEPSPLRFIVNGDMGIDEHARQLQSVAAAQDPQVALLGGDLAYSNGNWDHADRWDRWLDHWDSLMVTSTGDQIPIVSAIGNHEVRGGYAGTEQDAGLYLRYLPQSSKTFYDRQLGPHVALLVLDSGHLASHDGEPPGCSRHWCGTKTVTSALPSTTCRCSPDSASPAQPCHERVAASGNRCSRNLP